MKGKGRTTEGSWPNWDYYIAQSRKIEALWMRNNEKYRDLFKQILGEDPYEKPINEFNKSESRFSLFLRLLTLKLWFEQRDTAYH